MNNNDTLSFIKKWNYLYPIDIWWRKKYNVPFGSIKHREMSFIDMFIEFEEDNFFKELSISIEQNKIDNDIKDIDDLHNSTDKNNRIISMTDKEIDKEFDELNLDDYQ